MTWVEPPSGFNADSITAALADLGAAERTRLQTDESVCLEAADEGVSCFYIFRRPKEDLDLSFNFWSRLHYERASPKRFAKRAYTLLLLREADAEGLAHYASSLRDGSLQPRAFVETLMRSDEAQALNWVLLIAPDTADWLKLHAKRHAIVQPG